MATQSRGHGTPNAPFFNRKINSARTGRARRDTFTARHGASAKPQAIVLIFPLYLSLAPCLTL
jgi:hypothetical protein